MIEQIHANAELTIQQIRSLGLSDFGYNRESVDWLEGYIERLRLAGEFSADASEDELVSVFGSFLGECIVRCYGGTWAQRDGVWGVAFSGQNFVYPFAKVMKQMKHGLEDGIGSLFRAVPVIFKDDVSILPASPQKPWWRFW